MGPADRRSRAQDAVAGVLWRPERGLGRATSFVAGICLAGEGESFFLGGCDPNSVRVCRPIRRPPRQPGKEALSTIQATGLSGYQSRLLTAPLILLS